MRRLKRTLIRPPYQATTIGMEHDPSKLRRGGNALAVPARIRPCGFPTYQKRDGFVLTGSLLHQAKEIARCSDCRILHLLDHITRCDALAVRL